MKTYKKDVIKLGVLLVLLLAIFTLCSNIPATALADSKEIAINLYNDDVLYENIVYNNQPVVLPDNKTKKYGYTFQGWTDGFVTYQSGDTFSTELTQDISLYAVWKKQPEHNEQQKGIFNQTEKIILTVSIGILLALIAICYYWFAIKNRSFKDIKKLFAKKNGNNKK